MNIKPFIVADNESFVALNKPSGLLSIPDRLGKEPSLKDFLKKAYGEIFTVHRLDRDTSGLIVFAKNAEAHKALGALFEGRSIEKLYNGLVLGKPAQATGSLTGAIMEHPVQKGTMVVHAKGKAAHTDYEVLQSFKFYSWLQFRIHTGRTHQIRVHAKHMGHPIVCDPMYGDGKPLLLSSLKKNFNLAKKEEAERPILGRLALHSAFLQFELNEVSYQLEAPLPKDLTATLQQLRKLN